MPSMIDIPKLVAELKERPHYLRMTQLCAFRAHLRGKMHFSPTSNLAELRWVYGIRCDVGFDNTRPGGWIYAPVTREMVEAWVAPLYKEFAREPVVQV